MLARCLDHQDWLTRTDILAHLRGDNTHYPIGRRAQDHFVKPALKHRETREALSAALSDAGIAFDALDVAEDKSKGLFISVKLEASASTVAAREVLGRFPFPFSIN